MPKTQNSNVAHQAWKWNGQTPGMKLKRTDSRHESGIDRLQAWKLPHNLFFFTKQFLTLAKFPHSLPGEFFFFWYQMISMHIPAAQETSNFHPWWRTRHWVHHPETREGKDQSPDWDLNLQPLSPRSSAFTAKLHHPGTLPPPTPPTPQFQWQMEGRDCLTISHLAVHEFLCVSKARAFRPGPAASFLADGGHDLLKVTQRVHGAAAILLPGVLLQSVRDHLLDLAALPGLVVLGERNWQHEVATRHSVKILWVSLETAVPPNT